METEHAYALATLEATFLREARGWRAAEWATPSHCPGWTLRHVVAHLAQVAALLDDSVRRGLRGDGGPPPELTDIPSWRAVRAGRLQEIAAMAGADLLDEYGAAVSAMHGTFAASVGADPELRGWHPAGSQPLAWFPNQWLFELAVHDWDARVGLEASAELRPGILPAFGATLPPRLARWFGGPAAAGVTGRVGVVLEGPGAARWLVQVQDGAATVAVGTAAPADATVTTDVGAIGLIQTFRRPASYYAGRGRWQVAGDTALAAAFGTGFRAV